MSTPDSQSTVAQVPTSPLTKALPIPDYLSSVYWWAYVHPKAVNIFEREWLVNLILFGNYNRLRDLALDTLSTDHSGKVAGKVLQVACVYGNLTPRLLERLAPDASLDVVDILPVQLKNIAKKLPADHRVRLIQGDSSSLAAPEASYDHTLLFFLLHEQPEAVRRATLAEALRVTRPGGKIVIVDYHRPVALHPLRLLMTGVFRRLEPFAMDLWDHEIEAFMPVEPKPASVTKTTYFGGLYQQLVMVR